MIKTEFKLEFSTDSTEKDFLPVVVVAAGNSSRMQGVNKLLLEIGKVPVIARTLLAFETSPLISKIILVTNKDSVLTMQNLCAEYKISKLSDIVEGGNDRFSSVLNGISRLDKDDVRVLIHDGARPFVNNRVIGNVCAALQNNPAAICAVPLKDTVKYVDSDGFVINTPVRSDLYAVQTPQGVDVGLYKLAAEQIVDSSSVTDDASVMESAGHKVKIVDGDYKNIKITTPEDIVLANAILEDE